VEKREIVEDFKSERLRERFFDGAVAGKSGKCREQQTRVRKRLPPPASV
jgi:hypothetical protein